jgi:hypothetical protein
MSDDEEAIEEESTPPDGIYAEEPVVLPTKNENIDVGLTNEIIEEDVLDEGLAAPTESDTPRVSLQPVESLGSIKQSICESLCDKPLRTYTAETRERLKKFISPQEQKKIEQEERRRRAQLVRKQLDDFRRAQRKKQTADAYVCREHAFTSVGPSARFGTRPRLPLSQKFVQSIK